MEGIPIIEDERPMRGALEDALVAEGYHVLTAVNGETGQSPRLRGTSYFGVSLEGLSQPGTGCGLFGATDAVNSNGVASLSSQPVPGRIEFPSAYPR